MLKSNLTGANGPIPEACNVGGSADPCFAIVEDDAFMAQLVSDMLTENGARVTTFSMGGELLRCSELNTFTAVLMDLSLPDIDGFDLLDKLAFKATGLPILLMSGHSQAILDAACLYANSLGLRVLGRLCKPFSRAELYSALGLRA